MQTIVAGIAVLRRAPFSLIPMLAEAVVAGVLIVVGAIPAGGSSILAGAIFPLDVYFDVKQSLASASGWPLFVVLIFASLLIRSSVLATTLWLAADRPDRLQQVFRRAVPLVGVAAVALVPGAAFFFTGTATRYAPFIWIGAILGLAAAVAFLRRGLLIDAGRGRPRGRGLPELGGFLSYAYAVAAFGAAMSVLSTNIGAILGLVAAAAFLRRGLLIDAGRGRPRGRGLPELGGFLSYVYAVAAFGAAMSVLSTNIGSPASALLVVAIAPVHCLFFLGWREHLERETFPAGGTLALTATAVLVLSLLATSIYDRHFRVSEPVGSVDRRGTLLLLAGVDSTSESGALRRLDPRDVGFGREAARLLSYRGLDEEYGVLDTRRDLDEIASDVMEQIAEIPPPRFLLGHSQAALVVDRMLASDPDLLDAVAVLSPPPRAPPKLSIPDPDKAGPGKPGGDLARAISWMLGFVVEHPFDVDAPGAPTNLREAPSPSSMPRLAVWPLMDSVWLDRDWRRAGETNVVTVTDHVGVVNNAHALDVVRSFFSGTAFEGIQGDESSFAGFLAALMRYTFEPWRPAR